jgi:broad specificity phosphatase PhoE
MEKTIYFVRHGQSVDNVAPVYQSPDSPLSEIGRVQADAIAKRFAKIPFEILLSSPILRAKETAEAIQKETQKVPTFSELFVERTKPKSVDGKPYTDAKATMIWNDWEKSLHTPGMRVEEGENYEDITGRAKRALAYLAERPESKIAIVTHGYFLRTILATVLLGDALTPEAFFHFQKSSAAQNTGITVLQYRQTLEGNFAWRLWIFNDHSHLG